ncbi:hypothetical protein MtrunA17_Chr2g0303271 [Medicago truncatula]|uniref:PB1-like domain-containing protein n=1 Tax=Medicago truncatula TaxID=3880 RepID=A0A396JC36_MEDTR|nr:hypothetical protein MtrunA17_Chr2g0303271 [Medicago truncatula]
MDQIFECVVHHAGDFSCFMDPKYVGPVETLDCDPDFFSYFALLSTLKNCGYVSLKSLWYHDPSMEGGFFPLNSDSGCRRMQSIALQYDRVHLYVVHPMSQTDVVELDPLIEYPYMAPPVPPVVNESNEGPTDVGPTAEEKNAESGVSGPNCCVNEDGPEVDLNDLGPMVDENDLFSDHENGPEGVNEGVNEDGQCNEGVGEEVTAEREDSALGVHFGDSDDEREDIAGNLDSSVGGNEVNKPTVTLNEDPVFNDPIVNANAENVAGCDSSVLV